MAPKRKSAATTTKAKKAKVQKVEEVDPLQEKVQSIKQTLEVYEDDNAIQQLLVAAVEHAFDKPKDTRHKFHEIFIGMVDTTLRKFVQRFEQEVNKLKEEGTDGLALKHQKAVNHDRNTEALEKKSAEAMQKQLELSGKEESVKATGKQLKAKRAEKMKACGPLIMLENNLDEAIEKHEVFVKLRDDPCSMNDKDRKKLVTVLTPYLKVMKVDSSLIVSAPLALAQEVRTGFNATILQEITAQFDTYMSELKQKIELEAAAHRTIIDDVTEAEAATNAARDAADAARKELAVLEQEKLNLEQVKKDGEKDLKNHEKHMKNVDEDLATNVNTYEKLQKVYLDMVEIRDRSTEENVIVR
eukprot:GEMP01054385.1.p1 GENE.GEMP01054385.1~~GEMP01054385.1.p1  ORF type:complete len:376 (+),score=120.69 GEMP01054385.1:59-1129(+)